MENPMRTSAGTSLPAPVVASEGELAGASAVVLAGAFEGEVFADIDGAEVGVVPAALGVTVVEVVDEVGQLVVEVVVDVGAVVEVVEVVEVEVVVEVVDDVVVDVDVVLEVLVEVGVVVEVVDDEVVVEGGQFGTVVEVVVEDVVVAPVLPVFAALSVSAAGTAVDDARALLPSAGDPSAITAPRRVKVSSAPTLRARNLIEPPPIAVPRVFIRSECPEGNRKMNSPRPVRTHLAPVFQLVPSSAGHKRRRARAANAQVHSQMDGSPSTLRKLLTTRAEGESSKMASS
jgi:hypothetical protein